MNSHESVFSFRGSGACADIFLTILAEGGVCQFLPQTVEGGFHFFKLGSAGFGNAVHIGPDLLRIDAGEAAKGGWRDDA